MCARGLAAASQFARCAHPTRRLRRGRITRDHKPGGAAIARVARFEPSPCRSGPRLRLARRQASASALWACSPARHEPRLHETRKISFLHWLTFDSTRKERSCLATKSSRGRRCSVDVLLSSPVLCGPPPILTCIIQDRSCLKEAAEEFNGEAKMFVLCEGTVRVDAPCRGPKAKRERRRVAKVVSLQRQPHCRTKYPSGLQANALPLPFSGISRSARRQRFVVARSAKINRLHRLRGIAAQVSQREEEAPASTPCRRKGRRLRLTPRRWHSGRRRQARR